jgi:hypothetical protein
MLYQIPQPTSAEMLLSNEENTRYKFGILHVLVLSIDIA